MYSYIYGLLVRIELAQLVYPAEKRPRVGKRLGAFRATPYPASRSPAEVALARVHAASAPRDRRERTSGAMRSVNAAMRPWKVKTATC